VALADRAASIPWYHTIDLGHGVVTPGFVDHREQVPFYRWPESLTGMRCLDVATFDGFWAFEMERRGAAEVLGVDIADGNDCDLPRLVRLEAMKSPEHKPMGLGFRIAHDALGSKVEHRICSVYDLSPEKVGTFDFVNLGDLLLHLRDPQLALQRIASVCRGTFWMAEVYLPALEGLGDRRLSQFSPWLPSFTWWLPSTNTLRAMMAVAGFTDVEELDRFSLKTKDGSAAKVVYRAKGPARKA
jgi:tRNA (mo5U34)-methyltransferase